MTDEERELLKELVEAPYGQTEHILRKRGRWDDHAANPTNETRTFHVRVNGSMRVSAVVKIEARNVEEAQELAEEEADTPDFVWKDYGDVDVEDSEIVP